MEHRKSRMGPTWAPLVIGMGYAVASFLPRGLSPDQVYFQSPFMFTVFAGLTIAYACRPVMARIPWSRGAALTVIVFLLTGVGPLGDWLTAALLKRMDLVSFPLNLPHSPMGIILGALTGGALMTWLYRLEPGEITLAELMKRVRHGAGGVSVGRLALLTAVAAAIPFLTAWGDALWLEQGTGMYTGLVHPNAWLRLEGVLGREGGLAGWVGGGVFLLALWFRGALLVLPLVPVALALRGRWYHLTVVHGLLIFVLAEFAPLMVDQPFPSGGWLIARTLLGLGRSFAIGAAVTAGIRMKLLPPPPHKQ
ncbi:MAG: hypothetical protein OEW39_00395 [Deltaproteobacteria bacterium]|nr:hypothetical protein [Deltaproteobacteria bacterium]